MEQGTRYLQKNFSPSLSFFCLQLYSVDANPERKEFLDSLFEYMHKKGIGGN